MTSVNIKTVLSCFAVSITLNFLELKLGSSYLSNFLQDNLLSLLLTLMAINTATSTVISSKLESLSERYNSSKFLDAVKEIKHSLLEQIWLIGFAIMILIAANSTLLISIIPHLSMITNILLLSIFLYAIDILRDTGVAIFDMIIELNKED